MSRNKNRLEQKINFTKTIEHDKIQVNESGEKGGGFFTTELVAVVDKEVWEMDFTTIGTITSYLKQKNTKFSAENRIKAGQKVTEADGDLNFAKSGVSDQVDTKRRTDKEIAAARVASIKQKLSNGQIISDDELSYLRSQEPKTYKKAKHSEEAREDLKSELKKAKTKQEAKQAVTQALIKASAEASADIADCKSNSKSSGLTGNLKVKLNSVNDKVDGLSNVFRKTFVGNLGYTEKTDLKNLKSENFDAEKNNFYGFNFNLGAKKNNSKTSTNYQNSDQSSPQEIMEDFISTIRALEAAWAEFTKSKEYEELPNNKREEEFLKSIGETKHKDHYPKEMEIPRVKNLTAAAAYRNSMMFNNFKVEDFAEK